MPITIKQMRYALAVTRAGHFGRAAEACAVSQPALSQQILALEQICGTALFDRGKAGVRLTPFGREFVALAEASVEAADKLNNFALGHGGRPDRPLRFGLIPTVAPYLLPKIFPALIAALPEMRFAISESRTDTLLEGLEDGSIDIALIATEPPRTGPRLVTAALFEDAFVLATPRGEASAEPVSLTGISPERILLLDEGHCFRDQAISACRLEDDRNGRTFAATSLSTIVQFVANGQGVTLLPEIAIDKEGSDPRIAIHRLDDPSAGRQLRLAWREATPYGRIFQQIAEIVRTTQHAESHEPD